MEVERPSLKPSIGRLFCFNCKSFSLLRMCVKDLPGEAFKRTPFWKGADTRAINNNPTLPVCQDPVYIGLNILLGRFQQCTIVSIVWFKAKKIC